MTKNKKIIISVIIGLVLVAVVTTGTILALNVINNNKEDKSKVVTKATADKLRDQAEEARKNNDKAKAKTLLLEAQQQIKELPKTDENINAKVDVEAQLWLLEHASAPAVTPEPTVPTTPTTP